MRAFWADARVCLRWCLLVIALLQIQPSSAKLVKGDIISEDEDWVFITNFCFNTGIGNLSWTGWAPSDEKDLLLLFYDDASNRWPEVWSKRDELSCAEKVALANANRTIVSGEKHLQEFEDTRSPHFWYVVISKCSGGKLSFQYEFEFRNPGGGWYTEFSYDEFGLPGMYLFFWLLFTFGLLVHLKGVWELMKNGSFHPLVRLLTATLILETCSLFVIFIHYAVYADNGVGAPGLLALGEIFDMAAQLVFMLLLILIAKGFAITRSELTEKNRLLILGSVFLLMYLTMFIWEKVGRNPASSLYIYESAPGIILLILRCLTFGWFAWHLKKSYTEEYDPEKKKFYLMFGVAAAVWFLMLVLIVLTAAVVAAWYRFKVVTGMYLCMNTLGFGAMGVLLWPSRASTYFQISKSEFLLEKGRGASSPYESL